MADEHTLTEHAPVGHRTRGAQFIRTARLPTGGITESTTWMTPLPETTSADATFAPSGPDPGKSPC